MLISRVDLRVDQLGLVYSLFSSHTFLSHSWSTTSLVSLLLLKTSTLLSTLLLSSILWGRGGMLDSNLWGRGGLLNSNLWGRGGMPGLNQWGRGSMPGSIKWGRSVIRDLKTQQWRQAGTEHFGKYVLPSPTGTQCPDHSSYKAATGNL